MMSLDNSPFANRLNTNYVPSDTEVLQIRSLLAEPADALARMDARIEELEIVLAQLKEERALLKTPIDAHRALISPMRRIPQDVLIEIFRACLPSEHDALIDPAEAPLLLGHICRHWRSVAYSAPMLWSTIHIPWPEFHEAPPNILLRLEKIVEEWLTRSAACSLSVSLFDSNDRFDPDDPLRHPLVFRILPFSRRLRQLTLTGDAELLHPLLQLRSGDLPLLKSLVMHCHALALAPQDIFQIPTLEDVAIRMVSSNDPRSLPLHWSQLTSLRLECEPAWTENGPEGGLDLDGAFNVLRMCPVLMHCELRVTKGSGDVDSVLDTSPVTLPYLQTLILQGWHFVFTKWIPYLIALNLRFLRVGEVLWDATADSIPQDGSMSVTIDSKPFTLSGIEDLCRSFPLISHLRLFSSFHHITSSVDDEFLASLSQPHSLCPILTDVYISGQNTRISDAALLALIKARMAMPTPLRQIRAWFTRPMQFDIMPGLEPFISDGLQVAIIYPPPQWKFRSREGLDGLGHRRLSRF